MTPENPVTQTQGYKAERELGHQSKICKLIVGYLESDDFRNRAKLPNSQTAYRTDLVQFGSFCQENEIETLSNLDSEDVRRWISEMDLAKYAPSSINRKMAAARAFFDWLVLKRLLPTDFNEKLPEFKKTKRRLGKILTFEEVQELITETEKTSLRDAALVQIALKTGAKSTEIVDLTTDDILIDSKTGQVVVRFQSLGKTNGRTINLDRGASEIIKQHLQNIKLKNSQPLFTIRNKDSSKSLSRQGFWLILKQYGIRIGVPDLSPTMLRNTFAANLKGGVFELAKILGVSPSTATKIKQEISRQQVLTPKFKQSF